MPKIKTHKATAKRFKYSGRKKLRRTRGGGRAGKGYMRRRSKRSKRKASRMAEVTNPGIIKRVKKLAPYLKKK
jgi:large subunit ribosomal protein L35